MLNLTPTNNDIIDYYLDAYRTCNSRILYYSCNITTGKRYLKWFIEEGHELSNGSKEFIVNHHKKVIIPNIRDATNKVKILKSKAIWYGFNIVNPAALNNLLFTQDDYLFLWERFIKEIAQDIFFSTNWAYGAGSLYEYLIWIKNKKTLPYGSNSKILQHNIAMKQINTARKELMSAKIWTDFQEQCYKGIKNV